MSDDLIDIVDAIEVVGPLVFKHEWISEMSRTAIDLATSPPLHAPPHMKPEIDRAQRDAVIAQQQRARVLGLIHAHCKVVEEFEPQKTEIPKAIKQAMFENSLSEEDAARLPKFVGTRVGNQLVQRAEIERVFGKINAPLPTAGKPRIKAYQVRDILASAEVSDLRRPEQKDFVRQRWTMTEKVWRKAINGYHRVSGPKPKS